MAVNRRDLLGLIGAGATATAAPAVAQAADAGFRHGVAAGDPLTDRLIIWTRLTAPDGAPREVAWRVAVDPAFKQVVRRGRAVAHPERDHTVKVDVDGLQPGAEYFYQFTSGSETSPTGRARTLPAGPTSELVLAVASCQLYPGGLFNAYDAMSRLERLDAVVHLGDYIYEYGAGPDDYGMAVGARLGRAPDPPHETLTLADYRRRHAQYKADPDLQAAHARAAFICVWDDHETANDSWRDGAENHQPEREGPWSERRAASLRAYYEWMPIRERDPAGGLAIYRRFDFGDLASLHMLESRLLSRTHQLSYAELAAPGADVAAFKARLHAPERELLGEPQRAWLEAGLAGSRSAGRPWQVLGNQVIMAEVFAPRLEDLAANGGAASLAALPQNMRAAVERAGMIEKLGLPYNLDAWDGYPAARERLYETFKTSGTRPVVLSGDSHAFWANTLKDANGGTVAVELGASSISSPSQGDALGFPPLGEAFAARNDQVLFCDQNAKGYVLLTLRRDEAVAELRAVSTIFAKPYEERTIKRFRIPADPAAGHLVEI